MSGDPVRLAAAARLYAGTAGWKIFPTWGIKHDRCECGAAHTAPKDMGKHPLSAHGHKDASSDSDVIAAHWPDGGTSVHNIGVPCDANGFLVVDVDPRNGGLESWVKLESDLGGLPATLTAMTGAWGSSRGRHHYFTIPAPVRAAGAVFHGALKDYPGIDFKHKGYVLAPPSAHGSGVTYDWAVPGGPFSVAPVELPAGLGRLILKGSGRSGPRGGPVGIGTLEWNGEKLDVEAILAKPIMEGERVNVLYPIMCALANDYNLKTAHGEASFRHLIRGINLKQVRPPLPEEELEVQIKRAIEFVRDNPKDRAAAALALGPDLQAWVAAQKGSMAGGVATAGGTDAMLRAAAGGGAAPEGSGSVSELGATVVAAGGTTALGGGGARGPGGVGSGGGSGGPGSTASGGGPVPPDMDELGPADGFPFAQRTLTDKGNAVRLADYYGGTIRHTPGMGWFVWDNESRYWLADADGSVALRKAIEVLPSLVARELVLHGSSPETMKAVTEWSSESRSTAKVRAAVTQWQVRASVATPVGAWDSNDELLGVRNGVVNLRTGELLAGEPGMGITKRTGVSYERGMRAMQWEQFLEFATGGDREYIDWLQRVAGYTLTGRNDQDVFFIVFGLPGSGKSTLLEALSHALGEQYSVHLPVAALVEDGRGGSQDEYYRAQLPGKRMAVFSEWPTGARTKEDAIKQLTGDLTMTGRHPGGKPFDFQSKTKLWLGTNVLPAINDQAMWRRIRAVPFSHVPERPNPDLKLWLSDPEGGLPAVLAWCVEGAVKVLNSGARDPLGWCAAVTAASAEYKVQEDRMGQFLTEETVRGPGREVAVMALFEVYKGWAEERGERGMTLIPFRKALQERGVMLVGEGGRGTVQGLSLRPRGVVEAGAAELRTIASEMAGRWGMGS